MTTPSFYTWSCHAAIFFFFFVQSFSLSAQINVSGIIQNAESKSPVSDVSVYINNTKIGASSAVSGEYLLKGLLPGEYEIIVSHIGFAKISRKIIVEGENIRIDFLINPKVRELHNIVVMAKDMRSEWLDIFKQYFLGSSFAADKTRILNEDEVLFENGPTISAIRAYSDKPLIIENRELGYRIYFDLVEFIYDKKDMVTFFKGFSRFEELTTDPEGLKKYDRNRLKYYYGSSQHFYHSLIADDLAGQHFEVSLQMDTGTVSSKADKIENNRDGGRGKKRPERFIVGRDDFLLTGSSVPEKFYLYWKGQLRVRYKKDPYGKNRFQSLGFQSGMLSSGVESEIIMLTSPIVLSKNGMLENPLSVQYIGYWSFERIATLLPMDYRPGKN